MLVNDPDSAELASTWSSAVTRAASSAAAASARPARTDPAAAPIEVPTECATGVMATARVVAATSDRVRTRERIFHGNLSSESVDPCTNAPTPPATGPDRAHHRVMPDEAATPEPPHDDAIEGRPE